MAAAWWAQSFSAYLITFSASVHVDARNSATWVLLLPKARLRFGVDRAVDKGLHLAHGKFRLASETRVRLKGDLGNRLVRHVR